LAFLQKNPVFIFKRENSLHSSNI